MRPECALSRRDHRVTEGTARRGPRRRLHVTPATRVVRTTDRGRRGRRRYSQIEYKRSSLLFLQTDNLMQIDLQLYLQILTTEIISNDAHACVFPI